MKHFLALTALLIFSQGVQAFQSVCKITSSSVLEVAKVTVKGPMIERDFRLRLFDQQDRQIETGACDFSGHCYDRDDRNFSYTVRSPLSLRVTEKDKSILKMTIYPSIQQGAVDVECRLQR